MKILVPVKRVVDYNVKVRPKADFTEVDLEHVKMAMNPFDEIALEEAIRLKEKGKAQEIIVVSIGSDKSQETLRTGLAMGADRGILIQHEESLEPLKVAQLLKLIVLEQAIDLVLLGKQSIDGDNNQTGQMLSALLDWPQATCASQIDMQDNQLVVTMEVDGGMAKYGFAFPAVITADLRLNQPRYATLPNIMAARKKPLEIRLAKDLSVDLSSKTKLLKVEPPAVRKAGIKVDSVKVLVEKLRSEAGVL